MQRREPQFFCDLIALCLRRLIGLTAVAVFLGIFAIGSHPQSVQEGPIVIPEDHHQVSPRLDSLPSAPSLPSKGEIEIDNEDLPRPLGLKQDDPVLQSFLAPALIPTPNINFEGMGTGMPGFTLGGVPPDPAGDVGPNHYVQIVNLSIEVFNKDGSIALSFRNTNTLWTGFPGPCSTHNDGDGIVLYDPLADRWIISQFAVDFSGSTQTTECVAVSTSPDPTGSYFLYSFTYASAIADYPKMGVWHDAYYETFNMFTNGTTFAGARMCAYDRARMIIGQAATQQCFNTANTLGGLLPSDLDGSTPPPPGAPNTALALGSSANQLDFWKFHVDWTTPANSTFTGPTILSTAAFTEACGISAACIPQSGTAQQLAGIGDRLMFRLAYRNLGDHESLVANHSVTAGGTVGVRWYELRLDAATRNASIFQQGTYAPNDGNYRWMGSIAMDQAGDIGLGYSISSGAMPPGIRYTGRLPGDPAGAMVQGEGTIIAGGGSQTGGDPTASRRWGDYSMIAVDPADDCTFWYTNEYLAANGVFNWRTRIASFKFPTCSAATPTATSTPTPTNTATATATSTPTPVGRFCSSGGPVAILDDAYNGTLATMAAKPISVTGGIVTHVQVDSLAITHTWIGDLTIKLVSPQGFVVTLMSRPGFAEPADNGADVGPGNAADISSLFPIKFDGSFANSAENMGNGLTGSQTICRDDAICNYLPNNGAAAPGNLSTFNGLQAAGTWNLYVGDSAASDTGTLDGVCLNLALTGGSTPTTTPTNTATPTATIAPTTTATSTPTAMATPPGTFCSLSTGISIPDNSYNGSLASMASVPVNVSGPGTITGIQVSNVGITHTYVGDLTIKLRHPDGTLVTLLNRPGSNAPDDGTDAPNGDSSNISSAFPITFSGSSLNSAELMGNTPGDTNVICQDDGVCVYFPANDTASPGSLASFNGKPAAGAWTFFVGDSAAVDTGTLDGVCLNIQTAITPTPSNTPTPQLQMIVTGTDTGANVVKRFDEPSQRQMASFYDTFSTFTGGVRVAMGDVNGDGVDDFITGFGPDAGTPSRVRVLDGRNLLPIQDFIPFGGYTGGVFVAAGDLNGDGKADIIVGTDSGVQAHVEVFDGVTLTPLQNFLPFGSFTGGVRVAAGRVGPDSVPDIIVGTGTGAAQVTVFDGFNLAVLQNFIPYGGFTGGVYVAAGDLNGDGRADIITGSGSGAASNVKAFDGVNLSVLRNFIAFDPSFTGGVRVAAGKVNGDSVPDIVAGMGPDPNGAPQVRAFDGVSSAMIHDFAAYDQSFHGGIFVSAPPMQASSLITGTITYLNAIGAPMPRFVSNVTLSGTGAPIVTTITAAPGATAGQYTLEGFGTGAYTVTPSKTGGVNGVTSFDAGLIALHVAGPPNPQLSPNQLLVADVSGNGSVTSFDAGEIAKYVAGPPYAAPGIGATATWKFSPVSRNYASISSNIAGQDFAALLMGDVSGNWTNTGARAVNSGVPLKPASVSFPQIEAEIGKEVVIPVWVDGVANKGVISYEFSLRYDPSVIQPMSVPVDLDRTASRGLTAVSNAAEPGLLRVVVYGPTPIGDNGLLLDLEFEAVGVTCSRSSLVWESMMFNEGNPGANTVNGTVELR